MWQTEQDWMEADYAEGMFNVWSSDGTKVYQVDLIRGECTCPDSFYRMRECKHQRMVKERLGI